MYPPMVTGMSSSTANATMTAGASAINLPRFEAWARSRLRSSSWTTTNRHGCMLRWLGASRAAARTAFSFSGATGRGLYWVQGRKERIALWTSITNHRERIKLWASKEVYASDGKQGIQTYEVSTR